MFTWTVLFEYSPCISDLTIRKIDFNYLFRRFHSARCVQISGQPWVFERKNYAWLGLLRRVLLSRLVLIYFPSSRLTWSDWTIGAVVLSTTVTCGCKLIPEPRTWRLHSQTVRFYYLPDSGDLSDRPNIPGARILSNSGDPPDRLNSLIAWFVWSLKLDRRIVWTFRVYVKSSQ